MSENERTTQQITEDDVRHEAIGRRTFLGRFGLAAGVVGIAGMTQACGSGDASDGEASDADAVEATDADAVETTEPNATEGTEEEPEEEEGSSDEAADADSGS